MHSGQPVGPSIHNHRPQSGQATSHHRMMETDMEETLASGGITGLLTMAMLLAMRVYEARKAKANGGSTYDNIKQNQGTLRVLEERNQRVEQDVAELREKQKTMHRDLCEFREEFREFLAFQRGVEHAKRIKKD